MRGNPLRFTDPTGEKTDSQLEAEQEAYRHKRETERTQSWTGSGSIEHTRGCNAICEGMIAAAAFERARQGMMAAAALLPGHWLARTPESWPASSPAQGALGGTSFGVLAAAGLVFNPKLPRTAYASGGLDELSAQFSMSHDEIVQYIAENGVKYREVATGKINVWAARPDGHRGYLRVTLDPTEKEIWATGQNKPSHIANGVGRGRYSPTGSGGGGSGRTRQTITDDIYFDVYGRGRARGFGEPGVVGACSGDGSYLIEGLC